MGEIKHILLFEEAIIHQPQTLVGSHFHKEDSKYYLRQG